MTSTVRLSRSCRPLIAITVLGALLVAALPLDRTASAPAAWTPAFSEVAIETELRAGCQQLVGLIESGSPDAQWAVGRLRAAIATPAMGPTVQALAHHGLAIAYRTGHGVAADAAAAAAHEARSGASDVVRDARIARR